jgi:transposase-like protein
MSPALRSDRSTLEQAILRPWLAVRRAKVCSGQNTSSLLVSKATAAALKLLAVCFATSSRAGADHLRRAEVLRLSAEERGLRPLHPPGRLRETNRAENRHLPIRRRARKVQGFTSQAPAHPFLTSYAGVYNAFYTQRHLTIQRTLKVLRVAAFQTWSQATCA